MAGSNAVFGFTDRDSLFIELDRTIHQTSSFDQIKLERIATIRASLQTGKDPIQHYRQLESLYEEYKLFSFDSAFSYAKKLESLALSMNDPVRLVASRNKLSFVLLSAGLYKEAYDYLGAVQLKNLPDSIMADYYMSLGRYYYDLADYTSDAFYSSGYLERGNICLDSAMQFYPVSSFEKVYYNGLKHLKEGSMDTAFTAFHSLISNSGLTQHQLALTASNTSVRCKQTIARISRSLKPS